MVQLAQQQAWEAMKHYIEWMGETYLRGAHAADCSIRFSALVSNTMGRKRRKYAKTVNRNAHYAICFKSPRDKTGIRNLLLQVYPDKWRRVVQLFLRLTARHFGYFMLDLHLASDDRFRVWSHLTKREGKPQVHTFDEDIKRGSIR